MVALPPGRVARRLPPAVAAHPDVARFVAVLVLLVAVPVLLVSAPARAAGRALGLLAPERRITTVQLDQHAALWTIAHPDGAVAFSFTARNVSSGPRSYRWAVSSTADRAVFPGAHEGTFTLAGGAARRISVDLTLADCSRRTEILTTVSPTDGRGPDPRVSFWVEPSSAAAQLRDGRPTCGVAT